MREVLDLGGSVTNTLICIHADSWYNAWHITKIMCIHPPSRQARMCTWKDVLPQFEAHLQQSDLAQNTVAAYVHDVRSYALWLAEYAGQEESPTDFSSGDVEAYKEYLEDVLRRSPTGINRCLQSLRKFGRFAVTAGLRHTNPIQQVRLLESPVHSAPRTLTEAEVRQLGEVAEACPSRTSARDSAILQLLLQAGIRASELVQLRLVDIDLRDHYGTLTIRARGNRRKRQLPLNEAARSALHTYLQQPRPEETAHVFLNREGGRLSIRSVQRIVATLGEAVGLEISARTLRHTYAARLWRDTGDLSLLTERLGHKRPEAVLKYISPLPTTGSATEVL
jgi:integrase/recombinase XerD